MSSVFTKLQNKNTNKLKIFQIENSLCYIIKIRKINDKTFYSITNKQKYT